MIGSRTSDKFILRLPDGMRDDLKRIAKANGRSMNSEIIERLSASLKGDDERRSLLDDLRVRLDRLEKYVDPEGVRP